MTDFEARTIAQLPSAAFVPDDALVPVATPDGVAMSVPVGALFNKYLAVDVVYETAAELTADLAHADGAIALVYADPESENSTYWLKSGASGAGAWTRTNIGRGLPGPPGSDGSQIGTRAQAAASTIAPELKRLSTIGFASLADGGGAHYRRVDAQPAHPGRFRSVDRYLSDGVTISALNGGWWEIDETELYVEMFGAIGNDVANDLAAVNDAFATWKAQRRPLNFSKGKTYFLGDRTIANEASSRINLDNVSGIVRGNGAWLRVNTTEVVSPYVILIYRHDGLTISDLNVNDTGGVDLLDNRGANAFSLAASSGIHRGFSLIRCSALNCSSLFGTTPAGYAGAERIEKIDIQSCYAENCYYGLNCIEQGDNLVATLTTRNCRRSYFAYGCSGHRVSVDIFHDNPPSKGANACCLIKRYARDTTSIQLHARFHGSLGGFSNLVKIEHQPPVDGASTIDDIDVRIDVDKGIADELGATRLSLSSFTAAGVEQGATANVWSNIRLGGRIGNVDGAYHIQVRAQPTNEALIAIANGTPIKLDQIQIPGCALLLAPGHEMRQVFGDITANPVLIPVRPLRSRSFAMRIRAFALADTAGLAAQKSTYREDLLLGFNSGEGVPGIVKQAAAVAPIIAPDADPGATVNYDLSGENVRVSFAGAGYAGPNGFARVDTFYESNLK